MNEFNPLFQHTPASANPTQPPIDDETNVKIVQLADDHKTLPDGSKIIFAESDKKIVVHHKKPNESPTTYVFDRTSGNISVNNQPGQASDKKTMISLGTYLMTHCKESDLITISVAKQ